jgi:hypothetical protein
MAETEEKKPTEFLLTLKVTAVELAELEKQYPVMSVKVFNELGVHRG